MANSAPPPLSSHLPPNSPRAARAGDEEFLTLSVTGSKILQTYVHYHSPAGCELPYVHYHPLAGCEMPEQSLLSAGIVLGSMSGRLWGCDCPNRQAKVYRGWTAGMPCSGVMLTPQDGTCCIGSLQVRVSQATGLHGLLCFFIDWFSSK